MPTVTILTAEITPQDIAKASLAVFNGDGYPFQCPIGQALLRMFPGYTVGVSLSLFTLVDTKGNEYPGRFMRSARKIAETWDTYATRDQVKPCFVELSCEFSLQSVNN